MHGLQGPARWIGGLTTLDRLIERGSRRAAWWRRDDGAALVVVLLLLLGLAAMAMAAVMVSSTDLVVAGNDRRYAGALSVAEAGVDEALYRLSLTQGTVINVGGNAIDASLGDRADPPNPTWRTRIYLTAPGGAPAPAAGEVSTGTIQVPGSYLKYSDPGDAAQALVIQHKRSDLDGDGTLDVVRYDPSRVPPENIFKGAPVEEIRVNGRQGNARRSVLVEVIRLPITPNILGAVTSDGGVDLRGNIGVCGHNHRLDTPIGTKLPDCSPAFDEGSGHLVAVMTTGDDVLRRGSTDLLGSPAPYDSASTNPFYDLEQALGLSHEELLDILSRADHTSIDDPAPLNGITYIQGDASANATSGEGLLYVTGDLDLTGNFNWKGLVYVEGDLKCTGNVWILGGVMVRGVSNIALDMGAGTATVLYSREAIWQTLTRSVPYVKSGWKEI